MPKVPIPDEPLPKVFALTTPVHLLRKLWWEVKEFEAAENDNSELGTHLIVAYHAMNCAVTAWHMADWVWLHGGEDQRHHLFAMLELEQENFTTFVAYLRRNSRALNCCRDIATGSKHMRLERKGSDPDVEAEVVWDMEPMTVNSPVDAPLCRYTARLVVHDGQGARSARDVFREAFQYWEAFLAKCGYIEDRFVSGNRE
ncbi:MAG: hypothetical protein HONDAALG_04506 [Gammaproteobacteria bacterium]|nr:hypothetical protein [Gammaproteobacteria bacterium]